MGHERVGTLPKTRPWRAVVDEIAGQDLSEVSAAGVAKRTIENVSSRLRRMPNDHGVQAAFKFLVTLCVASGSQDPSATFDASGFAPPRNLSPLALARAIHAATFAARQSPEYAQISQSAAVDATADWYQQTRGWQLGLFESQESNRAVWRRSNTGAGFCELARLFFANFTQRYLNYFLEREASGVLLNISQRDRFTASLREHVDQTSKYAFETARITQSFAAGWYNNHARQGVPTDSEIQNFLRVAFGKVQEELLREIRT